MKTISVDQVKAELAKLDGQQPPADESNATQMTKKGLMRAVYPEICNLLEKGWKAKDVVKWLEQHGIKMKVGMFRVYLFELDQENGRSRRQSVELALPPPAAPATAPAPRLVNEKRPAPTPIVKAAAPTAAVAGAATSAADSGNDEEIDFANLASGFKMPVTNEKGFVEMPKVEKK